MIHPGESGHEKLLILVLMIPKPGTASPSVIPPPSALGVCSHIAGERAAPGNLQMQQQRLGLWDPHTSQSFIERSGYLYDLDNEAT